MLFDFVAELRKNPKLQADFLADPEGVMCREGLTDEEKEIVRSRDERRIMDAVVRQLGIALKEPQLKWFPPEPRITSISPNSGRRGKEVVVTIQGVFFSEGSRAELRSGDVRIVGAVQSVETEPNARITARFSLGADIPVGPYDVLVYGPAQAAADEAATLPGGFTVRK
ncbi:hypothetical protein [Polyangium spumosum]|uniref:Uncharacterized protein n=1 Tax=Polyangium spumosum TaxID=889282 RepID=A0A6N7PTQ4_9BACT|nr:hypothetical protein [Polyangium spumosum]MRG95438.1 hypothetical protein [Polyangium spumosum]